MAAQSLLPLFSDLVFYNSGVVFAQGVVRAPTGLSLIRPCDRGVLTMSKSLDDFVEAAAAALGIPLEDVWKPAVKANLEVILRHADMVAEFKLPDDAEPAPVFKA